MDYKFKVLLNSGLFADIDVRGYDYLDDAKKAALSMTGGKSVVGYSVIQNTSTYDSPKQSTQKTNSYQYYSNNSAFENQSRIDGYLTAILGLSLFILIGLISVPYLTIPGLILFTLWWFSNL